VYLFLLFSPPRLIIVVIFYCCFPQHCYEYFSFQLAWLVLICFLPLACTHDVTYFLSYSYLIMMPTPWWHSLDDTLLMTLSRIQKFSPYTAFWTFIFSWSHINLTKPLSGYWKSWLLVWITPNFQKMAIVVVDWLVASSCKKCRHHPRKKQQSNCAVGGMCSSCCMECWFCVV